MDVDEELLHSGLSVRALWKRYTPRGRWAAKDISLSVEPGEICALVGPNGAGKSTVIKCILRLVLPQRGTVLFRGRDIRHAIDHHMVGYMPDRLEPYPFESLTEFALKYVEWQRPGSREQVKERLDRIMDVAEEFRVGAWKDKPFYSWSLGMKQRALLSLVLACQFSLLVLDEPTQALDPVGRRLVLNKIRTVANAGATVVVCSHLLSDLENVADKVGLMYAGRLLAETRTSELRERQEVRVRFLTDGGERKVAYFRKDEPVSLHGLGANPTVEEICVRSASLEDWYLKTVEEAEQRDLGEQPKTVPN